jgi:glyoxylase-like metal-dependent hydrolase (beta-lactamase superfamily II)
MNLSPSLHQIGSNVVNCYLVEEAGQITIVDAGLPGQWRELIDTLAQMGRSLDDVRAIVLTHGDTDHIGFAARLNLERGVPIYIHELDAARARGQATKVTSGWGPVRVRPLARFLLYSARRGGLRIPPLTELVTFTDGATLDVPGSPRVIGLPGHTPGSVAYHVPGIEALIVGDAMTTRSVLTGEAGPRPAPFTLDPLQALASLDRLDGVKAKWVLPGHGEPWSGGAREAVYRFRSAAGEPTADVDAGSPGAEITRELT